MLKFEEFINCLKINVSSLIFDIIDDFLEREKYQIKYSYIDQICTSFPYQTHE